MAWRSEASKQQRREYCRKYHSKHAKALRAKKKARYAANKKALASRTRAWYKQNRSKALAYGKVYRAQALRKARRAELAREWRRTHSPAPRDKAKVAAKSARRRALIKSVFVPFTDAELANHLRALGEMCIYCHGPYHHLDHFIPLKHAGAHSLANIVPACAPCNLSKGSKMPSQWLTLTEYQRILSLLEVV